MNNTLNKITKKLKEIKLLTQEYKYYSSLADEGMKVFVKIDNIKIEIQKKQSELRELESDYFNS